MRLSKYLLFFILSLQGIPLYAEQINCPPGTIPNGETTPEVSESWCELESNRGILHGPYRAWYPNGNLGTSEMYDHGKLTGPAVYFWDNGEKQAEGKYKNGLREGFWKFWDKSGILYSKVRYLKGKVISGKIPEWAAEKVK
jgi:antitoxin component YwqK of YwqJK toxin-antitoxin module